MNAGTNNEVKTRLLAIPSVIIIEPTCLTESSGKWLVLVQKSKIDQTRKATDIVINETLFYDSKTEIPGRSNRYNINSSLVTYAAALQKESTSSTIQLLQPPQNAYKRHIRVSYDIENRASFPVIGNKKKKTFAYNSTRFQRHIYHHINKNDESTIVSSFLMASSSKYYKKTIINSKKRLKHLSNTKSPNNF